MPMRVDHHEEAGVVVVAPEGDIDIDTASHLRQGLAQALDLGARTVVVDLADVGFMDSTGIGQLAWLLSTGAVRVAVVNARPIVRNALHLMGLDQRMEVHNHGEAPCFPGMSDTRGRAVEG